MIEGTLTEGLNRDMLFVTKTGRPVRGHLQPESFSRLYGIHLPVKYKIDNKGTWIVYHAFVHAED